MTNNQSFLALPDGTVANKLTADIVKQLENDSAMLGYLIPNFDQVSELPLNEQLHVMARIQYVVKQLSTIELRLREEIIPHFDPEVGKTKSKTDRELGFKIETGRPVSVKFYNSTTDALLRKLLGVKNADLNDLFPAKRSYSAGSYNKLSEEQQKALTEALEVKVGQIACKVSPL